MDHINAMAINTPMARPTSVIGTLKTALLVLANEEAIISPDIKMLNARSMTLNERRLLIRSNCLRAFCSTGISTCTLAFP